MHMYQAPHNAMHQQRIPPTISTNEKPVFHLVSSCVTVDARRLLPKPTPLNLALSRLLLRFPVGGAFSSAALLVRNVLRAAIRSSGVASRIRRRFKVFRIYSDMPVRERRRSCAVVLSSLAVVTIVKGTKVSYSAFRYAMIYVVFPLKVFLDKCSECTIEREIGTWGLTTHTICIQKIIWKCSNFGIISVRCSWPKIHTAATISINIKVS